MRYGHCDACDATFSFVPDGARCPVDEAHGALRDVSRTTQGSRPGALQTDAREIVREHGFDLLSWLHEHYISTAKGTQHYRTRNGRAYVSVIAVVVNRDGVSGDETTGTTAMTFSRSDLETMLNDLAAYEATP